MSKTIKIKVKSVYGNDLIYVVSEHSDAIEHLTGKRTINKTDISNLQTLGFEFVQVV